MAKKRPPNVDAIASEPIAKAVRLDLMPDDHARLDQIARRRGLTKSAYARMVVLEAIEADERRLVAKT